VPTWLVQLLAVARKEVRQTVRDKRMVFMLLGAPLLQLIVFGSAVDFDVDRVPTVVVDHDRTEASRTHLRRLFADGTLVRVADLPDEASAEAMLDTRAAAVVLVVPARFGANLARGRSTPMQVVVDGTDANRGSVAASAVARYFQQVAIELSIAHGRVPARPRSVARVLYNPSLRTAMYIVPGIAAMILLIITTVVMAMGLAREREMGTLEQVLVTPLSPRVLMLGKLLPFVLIGLIDFGVALVAGSYVFGMPLRGSVPLVLCGTLLYLLCTLGIGLFVSTVARTQQQAFMAGFLVMLPAILLSGTMTPIDSMPDWMRPLTLVNPLRYFIAFLRKSLLEGAGLDVLWPNLLALAALGAALFALASLRFRRTLA
jgi:ABC-2 type transport system permease protein